MSTLNEPVAKLISKIFRRLASDFEGEQLNAVAAMKHLFASEGLSFSDIATVIENASGEIEELKFSEGDMDIAFKKGMEKGRAIGQAEGHTTAARSLLHRALTARFSVPPEIRARIDREQRREQESRVAHLLPRRVFGRDGAWLRQD